MFYTIYEITNKINGKIYIGKHQTKNINDSYYGSGKAIVNAIKLYGKENFDKKILFVFDNEYDMNLKEKELITEEFVCREDTYNLGVGGEGGAHFKGKRHNSETKTKLSKIASNKKHSDETKKKISDANRKRVWSDKTKKLIRDKALERSRLKKTAGSDSQALVS